MVFDRNEFAPRIAHVTRVPPSAAAMHARRGRYAEAAEGFGRAGGGLTPVGERDGHEGNGRR